jgi:hypothetical protein
MSDEDQTAASKIEVKDTADPGNVDLTAGLEDGAEVIDQTGEATGEKIVHEKDEKGNVTGWHKEAL